MVRRRDPIAPIRLRRQLQRQDDEIAMEMALRRRQGATGPSSKVSLGTLKVTQTALIQLVPAGMRTLTFTGVTGALPGDDLLLFPVSALPAGYAIHHARCPTAGTVEVTLTAPLLAVNATFSIACRLVALR